MSSVVAMGRRMNGSEMEACGFAPPSTDEGGGADGGPCPCPPDPP